MHNKWKNVRELRIIGQTPLADSPSLHQVLLGLRFGNLQIEALERLRFVGYLSPGQRLAEGMVEKTGMMLGKLGPNVSEIEWSSLHCVCGYLGRVLRGLYEQQRPRLRVLDATRALPAMAFDSFATTLTQLSLSGEVLGRRQAFPYIPTDNLLRMSLTDIISDRVWDYFDSPRPDMIEFPQLEYMQISVCPMMHLDTRISIMESGWAPRFPKLQEAELSFTADMYVDFFECLRGSPLQKLRFTDSQYTLSHIDQALIESAVEICLVWAARSWFLHSDDRWSAKISHMLNMKVANIRTLSLYGAPVPFPLTTGWAGLHNLSIAVEEVDWDGIEFLLPQVPQLKVLKIVSSRSREWAAPQALTVDGEDLSGLIHSRLEEFDCYCSTYLGPPIPMVWVKKFILGTPSLCRICMYPEVLDEVAEIVAECKRDIQVKIGICIKDLL
ncbi:hypothetical protein FBU59_002591 [Linderina macrospora]|uniref:Uncharacterized protein n=1 Tax=Linderina macrospora TaxID=4868 RepID=A0ACC1JB01_9FUNG|nr:hypothetical protein FBU59_002591 [Linderina macrospora]